MPVDKPHINESGVYFITFTNYNWLPLFDITGAYDSVYKWFDYLKLQGHEIAGYVIMPNHLHVLIWFNENEQSINKQVSNGKRFMAYDVVSRLQGLNRIDILKQLADGVSASDRQRGKLHQVFNPSFDMKLCYGKDFIKQKLDYIHMNPLNKKWQLVADATLYKHSSALFYETGEQGIYSVANIFELSM